VTESPNPHMVDTDTLSGQMRPIRRAVLSLGSNLGDRFTSLQGALSSLADTPDFFMVAVSPVYETTPVDAPPHSPDFLNAIVIADTTLSAGTLLDRAQAIEDAFGRERNGELNAPRTLDVDMIVLGDRVSETEDLVLPHPRASQRAFVLRPWLDVDPDAEIPGTGRVEELLAKLDEEAVRLRADLELDLQ
jgi:2-amino-4-hydroxy-6-hydroxymethyldihydropteridine diphosphokinase